MARIVYNQRHLSGFLVRQHFGAVTMRTAEEAVIRGIDDHGVVGNTMRVERFADHADGDIDGINLLMVNRHDLVVSIGIAPAFEAFVLAVLLALFREVLTVFTSVVDGLNEGLLCVDSVKPLIGCGWFVRCFKTNR